MDRAEIVFNSYNTVIEDCYNKVLTDNKPDSDCTETENRISECIRIALKHWSCAPLTGLGGVTPDEYFNNIQDFGQLLNVFKTGSKICDEGLPDALACKLRSFGDRAIRAMLDIARDKSLAGTEDVVIPLMAVRLLGGWKEAGVAAPLADIMLEYEEEDYDIIREQIANALTDIGLPALEPVLVKVEAMLQDAGTGAVAGNAFDSLNLVLADIGRKHRSDRVYRCLKSAFLKSDSKYTAAACLGTYGDGRAVAFLRGYTGKNLHSIDEDTLYEIKHAVEILGGSMDDILSSIT